MEIRFKREPHVLELIEAFRGERGDEAIETFLGMLEPTLEAIAFSASKIDEKEFHYLKWFHHNADFGPADCDVHSILREDYKRETGRDFPKTLAGEE